MYTTNNVYVPGLDIKKSKHDTDQDIGHYRNDKGQPYSYVKTVEFIQNQQKITAKFLFDEPWGED